MDILINVTNQKLKLSTNVKSLVEGSQKFVRFVFNLTSDWDGLSTFAQFTQEGNSYNAYLDVDNSVFLPAEIGAGTCTLMLYGSGETTIGTTNYLTLTIDENILVANADSTEISTSLYNQLITRINRLETYVGINDESLSDLIEEAVAAEMQEYLDNGKLANIIIGDGSLTKEKVDADFSNTLNKADSAMQPSVYDPQNKKVDIFAYAEAKTDTVQNNLDKIKKEIQDAYVLSDTVKYQNLGDAVRGAVTLSKNYAQALLVDYKAFTVKIVDELPIVGESMTFYLLPNKSGTGYDKYWWITDNNGDSKWDVFGSSSTLIITELPEIGEEDTDYILKSDAGCLYYKYIDGNWEIIAGSVVKIVSELPEVGNELTDYYLATQEGTYVHYRYINGSFHVIGGNSFTKDQINNLVSELEETLNDDIQKNTRDIEINSKRIDNNEKKLSDFGNSLTNLQQELRNIDTEGYTYFATYGEAELASGEVASNVFTLHQEKDGVSEVVSQFIITGGSGGSGGSATNLVVERVTPSPVVVTPTDKVEITINYSSTDSDGETVDGTYTWKIGNSVLETGSLIQGENTFDLTDYVSLGSQKLTLTVVDEGGSVNVKTWTVRIVDVKLESTFNDSIMYSANTNVSFSYKPTGSGIDKTVHFIFDGEELEPVITQNSGISMQYQLPKKGHGAHLLECYITATVNNMPIETEHIYKDIIYVDETSDVPIISCIYRYDYYGKVSAKQYDSTNITYYVYDPNTRTPTVIRNADGVIVATQTLITMSDVWTYKTDIVGEHILIISCGDTSVTIIVDTQELGVNIIPITANLAFDFNPTGLSNSSENRLWKDDNSDVNLSVSDNFDWTNGGYQLDADGNQYFCIKAGTTAVINYNLFGNSNVKTTGSEFKIIFKTTNVRNSDATFLTCESDDIVVGLRMNTHEAYFRTSGTGDNPLYIPYSEEDIIEFEYNINPIVEGSSESIIMSYEDGVGLRPLLYNDGHRLHQYSPVPITIGSQDCDVHIYRMKAYTSVLSDSDILSNFIADARNSDDMLNRYYRNQIYNENNTLTPESVAAACPDLKIIKIDCPYFTQDKNEMVKNTSVECIHKNGDAILDNWKAINCYHSGQGTTSNEYGFAGRNMNFYMCFDGNYTHKRVTYDPSYITELTMGDGTKYTDGTGKITLTRNSVPNNIFNIKVNIASSENANNALLAKRFNDYLPYKSVAQNRDSRVKNTMEFVNCVVFVRENDKDLTTHREFQDNEWHFYAIGNLGDSKDTDYTRVNDPTDPREFVVEISDNTFPNSDFPTGVSDKDGKRVYPINKSQWVAGNVAYDNLYNAWDDTFEFRYEMKGIADEQSEANKQVWRDFYEWVITSTDEEFVNELKDWFIVDSALYFYLFTERFTMVDNRAKNTFWHYSKVYISQAEANLMGNEAQYYTIDDEAAAINDGYRFEFWDYDNDTALGINNSGELTMTYGKEDIDYRIDGDPNSGYVYNAAESTFYRRIRNLMHTQLQTMHSNTESAWSSTDVINKWDTSQAQFPEELWRIDIERKYYRTYYGGDSTFLKDMMNGRKKYQRRQFERDQDGYISTKYIGTNIKSDQIWFRCNTPLEAVVRPYYNLKITPYSDMYLTVIFGNTSPTQIRAKANVEYEVQCTISADENGNIKMDDTMFVIYYASRIKELNDLSACYIHDSSFGNAVKLQKLILGNSTEGYQNTFFTDAGIGNNTLLQELNIRNCPNLVGSLDLTKCTSLETLYAEGSSITGVLFAPYGKIQTAYLPNTINNIRMNYLHYLTDLQVSYDRLESLTIQYSPIIDEYAIVTDAVDTLQELNLAGIDWTLLDTSLLNTILKMSHSSLIGKVFINGQIRNQELISYQNAWPDLEIIYDSSQLVTQYLATYVNANGEVLCSVYIDRGGVPIDPIAEGIISTPTLQSTAQYDFEYAGWDDITSVMLEPRTITAQYTEHIRSYTVRWFAREGLELESTVVNYGDEAVYSGEIPTRKDEESAYVYNLFTGWNKNTGFVKENIDVYAIWERAELPKVGKDLSEMTPTEIYGVATAGSANDYFVEKDYFDLTLGHDFNFTNVESELLAEELYLNGDNYVDTGIQLFGEEEKSFTIAIDFQFQATDIGSTLLSCYEEDGSEGFRLRYNGYPNLEWGNVNCHVGYATFRDMLVLRHRKGEDKLYVYFSNGTSNPRFAEEISITELTRNRLTKTSAPIVLGAHKWLDDNEYADIATGVIHWCKVWFDDLGDTNAKQLATWYHEKVRFEFYGTERYKLAESANKKSNASFIANNLLESRTYYINSINDNTGGWDASLMRTFCNSRIYNAMPVIWKSIIKKVKINSNAGGHQSLINSSEDYVYLPSVVEISGTTQDLYKDEGEHIPWFVSNENRIKFAGIIIPSDVSYYSMTTDPTIDNTIKTGDIWVNGNNSCIYFDKESIKAYNIIPNLSADDGGGWVYSSKWWERTASNSTYQTNNTEWFCVDKSGSPWWYIVTYYQTNVRESNYICPCFSI